MVFGPRDVRILGDSRGAGAPEAQNSSNSGGEPLTGARRAVQCAYLFLGFDGPSTTTDDSGLWPARSLASRSL